ncbi:hypothetical protein CHUAL_011937 [Chamberlinius hualienensis]
MADNAVIKLSLNGNSVDSEYVEDPLIEIKKLNEENNRLKITQLNSDVKKLFKWIKILSVFSVLLILIAFVFPFSFFHSNLAKVDVKIEALKRNENETLELINLLHDKHQILEFKADIKHNFSGVYLKRAEEKHQELLFVLQEANKFSKRQLSEDEIWNKSLVLDLNITSLSSGKTKTLLKIPNSDFDCEVFTERTYSKLDLYLMFNAQQSFQTRPEKVLSKMTYALSKISSLSKFDQYSVYCELNGTQLTKKWFQKTLYLFSQFTNIKLLLEPQEIAEMNTFSFNGTLLWKTQLRAYSGASPSSPYFYTSPNGYRMKLLISNGNNLVLNVICGENDANLPKIISFRMMLTIFNQKDPMENLEITDSFSNVSAAANRQLYNINTVQFELMGYTQNKEILLKFEIVIL